MNSTRKRWRWLALLVVLFVSAFTLVASGPAGANQYRTRFTDIAPYFGGDRIDSPTEGCTSGFQGFDHIGYSYALTAAHCGWSPSWTTNSGDDFGPTVASSAGLDTQLITEDTVTHNWGYFFTGTNSATREVYSWETTPQDARGNTVCYDGSSSRREICGIVDGVNQGWNGQPSSVAHAVNVHCPAGSIGDCTLHGDSGAPAYAIVASGPYAGYVEAVGTFVGSAELTLNGTYWWDWVFIPIRYEVAYMQAHLSASFNIDCVLCS